MSYAMLGIALPKLSCGLSAAPPVSCCFLWIRDTFTWKFHCTVFLKSGSLNCFEDFHGAQDYPGKKWCFTLLQLPAWCWEVIYIISAVL